MVERLLASGVAAGVPLAAYYAGMENALVVTVTEKRTKAEIDRLAEPSGGGAMQLIYEKSVAGRTRGQGSRSPTSPKATPFPGALRARETPPLFPR